MLDAFFAENPVSSATRALYERALTGFLASCDPATCTAGDVLKYLDTTKWGSSLKYTATTAIKKFLRWKYGADHPALRVRVKREPSKPGRALNAQRALKVMEHFDLSKVKGKRDLAIYCLAIDTGLRVNELATLKNADVDLGEQKLMVRIKGGKWKDAFFSDDTRSAIADWMNHRRAGDDRLFQLTRDGLRVIVRRWGEKLGFRISPHDFRRTFATLSTRNGAPSRLVQIAGRWSSIEMVERYTQTLTAEDFNDYFPTKNLTTKQKQ